MFPFVGCVNAYDGARVGHVIFWMRLRFCRLHHVPRQRYLRSGNLGAVCGRATPKSTRNNFLLPFVMSKNKHERRLVLFQLVFKKHKHSKQEYAKHEHAKQFSESWSFLGRAHMLLVKNFYGTAIVLGFPRSPLQNFYDTLSIRKFSTRHQRSVVRLSPDWNSGQRWLKPKTIVRFHFFVKKLPFVIRCTTTRLAEEC